MTQNNNSGELALGGDQSGWDPAQFKLQPDGTFRISVRGMAAMAGIDDNGLGRSLKSAADENPLPCARSLLAQGFNPADVSGWSATGGIPEVAAPFILEHYGILASNLSRQARQVLLAFSRVGINAYLKERLGIHNRELEPAKFADQAELGAAIQNIKLIWDIFEEKGVCDDRDRLEIKRNLRLVLQTSLMAVGSLPGSSAELLNPVEALPRFGDKLVDPEAPLTIVEFATCYLTLAESRAVGKLDYLIGRSVHSAYKARYGEEAGRTTHLSTKAEKGRRRLHLPVFGTANNGNAVSPRVYLPRDWDLIIEDLRQRAILTPDRAANLRAQLQQFRYGQTK